jgi:HAE1 family hydrophobic/amphiphilic exporter-1
VIIYLTFANLPGGFIPDEDQGYFFVNVQLPDGASSERTTEVLDRINAVLAEAPGVEAFITIGGYSFLNGVQGSNYGAVIATLFPWDDRGDADLHVESIIRRLQGFLFGIQEGVAFAFGPPPIMGLGAAGGFTMEMQDRTGLGYQLLETFARDMVAGGLQSPRLTRLSQNFSANVPQIFVDVDRNRAKTYGVPLQSVFSTLQANLGSAYVNDFNVFGRTWKVMVQADQQFRSRARDIAKLEVRSQSGRMIPIGALAEVRDTTGPQVVRRFNMFPSATISGQAAPGFSENQATAEMEVLAGALLPTGMGYSWSGVTYQQKAAGNLAPLIFGLAIVFVFLFLAAQYESWTIPLAVMLSIPLSFLGAAGVTLIRGLDNNIYMQIGLVLLIGLSAKSAIMIVEFAKQLNEEGKPVIDAAVEAARLRFRPILMTAFSFILGVIPLLIASGAGASSRQSLGTAVFGGMLVATVTGVFFVPVLYVVVMHSVARLTGKAKAGTGPELESGAEA